MNSNSSKPHLILFNTETGGYREGIFSCPKLDVRKQEQEILVADSLIHASYVDGPAENRWLHRAAKKFHGQVYPNGSVDGFELFNACRRSDLPFL